MTKLKLLFFCLCFNLIGVDAKLEANKSIPKSSSEVKKSNKGALMNLFKKKMKKKRRPSFKKYIANRIGGAVRGNAHTQVANLAPSGVGLSSVPSPTLCWSLDSSTNHPVQITIVEQSENQFEYFEPILKTKLTEASEQGIHCYSLRNTKVQLEPETVYLWSTRVLSNQDDLSDNAIAQAYILYSEQNEAEFFYDNVASASMRQRQKLMKKMGLIN